MKVVEVKSPVPGARAYLLGESGNTTVIVGLENGKWHLSIAHPLRYPSWDEIKWARYRFVPDSLTMAMLLPPRKDYVNVNRYCFHLYEIIEGEIRAGICPPTRP